MTMRYGEGFAGRLMKQEMDYRAGEKAGNKWKEWELQELLEVLTAYYDMLRSRTMFSEPQSAYRSA